MGRKEGQYISMVDLYLAYKKAKAEAYYESTHFHAVAFTQYEKDLDRNLRKLYGDLVSKSPTWMNNQAWLGGFSYAPKSVDRSWAEDEGIFYRFIDPLEEWSRGFSSGGRQRATASFRLVITASVNFQIVSALWIIKVGHKYDAILHPELSFGNRLRRKGEYYNTAFGPRQNINEDCVGLFSPYFSAYNKWRGDGLKAMRESLESGQRIVAITMDVQRFYHRIDPGFLLNKHYLEITGIPLSKDDYIFTKNIVYAIQTWYQSTPDFKDRPKGAIPVGLSASKIIANVLLAELDDKINKKLKPIYYGRYVDDIFMVLGYPGNAKTGDDIMGKISGKIPDILKYKKAKKGEKSSLHVNLKYAKNSELIFTGAKQKIFNLSGEHGLDLINQVTEQIRKHSSEHRLLPDLPRTAEKMASRALLAQPDASLEPDALRKADVISVKRLGLSLLLRDVECYARDLSPASWRERRQEFYGLVYRHVLTPVGFFDFFAYIHRVFGLMVACGDFEDAESLIQRLVKVARLLAKTTTSGADDRKKFDLCKKQYARAFVQVALQASSVPRFMLHAPFLKLLKSVRKIHAEVELPTSLAIASTLSKDLLYADWGRRPYREVWLHRGARPRRNPPVPNEIELKRFLRLGAIREFRRKADLRVPYWPPLVFPTRPLTLSEITIAAPSLLDDPLHLRSALFAFRGAKAQQSDGVKSCRDVSDSITEILVNADASDRKRVAITNVLTTETEWQAAVDGKPRLDIKRYERIRYLINQIMRETDRPDYIVFPECSLPMRWARGIAYKLAHRGISLIAGLEYQIDSKGVHNDALVSLVTKWPWYSSNLLYIQPKCAPSHDERQMLWRSGRKKLFVPGRDFTDLPIYVHGGFCFGVLLCSDLTNIKHRLHFRGFIDALVILEWNKDIETFGFMVESAAQDLHAYVIQANNRMYGDSRIRIPRKLVYERDVIRVKGGVEDYFVTALIDIAALRAFQKSKPHSGKGDFKPVSIGYSMSERRKNNL